MRKVLCARHHRMVPITAELAICECSAYGRTYLKGMEDEARRMVERCGGIEKLRDDLLRAEEVARRARADARRDKAEA